MNFSLKCSLESIHCLRFNWILGSVNIVDDVCYFDSAEESQAYDCLTVTNRICLIFSITSCCSVLCLHVHNINRRILLRLIGTIAQFSLLRVLGKGTMCSTGFSDIPKLYLLRYYIQMKDSFTKLLQNFSKS